MQHQPTDQQPEPAVHYLTGLWVASCPTCGFQLTSAWTQAAGPAGPGHLGVFAVTVASAVQAAGLVQGHSLVG